MRMTLSEIHTERYCRTHTVLPHPALDALERTTHLNTLHPHQISGPVQGALLTLLSSMLSAKSILELGTFTGYGTACLASGLAPGGKVITIEGQPEVLEIAQSSLKAMHLDHLVQFLKGDILELLPTLAGPFDLIYLDARKLDYPLYWEMLVDRITPGGLLVADNVLWYGQVLTPESRQTDEARALHQFNELVQQDPRLFNLLLPVRDGLMIARRIP